MRSEKVLKQMAMQKKHDFENDEDETKFMAFQDTLRKAVGKKKRIKAQVKKIEMELSNQPPSTVLEVQSGKHIGTTK